MLLGELTCLRAIERADLPKLLEWRNKPHLRRYFREHRELSMAQQEMWFETTIMKDPRTLMFSVIEKVTHRLLGATGLCYLDPINRSADLSLYIGVDDLYIDEAFAPDASHTLLRYGFDELNLHRIWSEIYCFDVAKQKLLVSLGFQQEGRHRHTHWSEGKWFDSLFYGLLIEDHCPRRK